LLLLNGRENHSDLGENKVKRSLRFRRLIEEFIGSLNLDLSGLVVLTEAASGNYVVTPLIAAMANAEKVIGVTKDSKYGRVKDIIDNTLSMAKSFGIKQDNIQILDDLTPDLIEEADIVTNLGFVRPISKGFIYNLKKSAVISLMYETWEFREEDLDLAESLQRGIPVLGVNEQHATLKIFDYIGHLCMKILFEAGLEIFKSKIVVAGNSEFGKNIIKTLADAGADVLCATSFDPRLIRELGGAKIGNSIRGARAQQSIKDCDALIVNTYPDQSVVIGESGDISPARLLELSPETVIVQFNGLIERKSLDGYGFTCLPREEPTAGHMGWTLAHLGPKPVIALNCGGLKVGEVLARARLKGLGSEAAKRKALKNPICQDFSFDQYKKYRI
jgi:hypothetical protein